MHYLLKEDLHLIRQRRMSEMQQSIETNYHSSIFYKPTTFEMWLATIG